MNASAERDERGPSDRPALTRLTGLDAADFARDHWDETPLLARNVDHFDDLFSAEAVDELVADRALRTPFARMASEGEVLDHTAFTSSGGVGAEVGDQLDSGKVLEQFANGATLVLQGLHRTWEPIARFTRQLIGELGHPAQVNAYITPASSRGFDPHYDTHDVFVIQIAGAKRWTIHEPVYRHPLAHQPWSSRRAEVQEAASHDPVIDAVFEPGDVLYLPRGWLHSAIAQGSTSIHLTIGLRATTRHDLLWRMLERSEDDPALRASLALGVDFSDPTSLSEDLEETARAAHTLLERSIEDSTIAPSLQLGLAAATRPAPVRPLATVDLASDLPPGTLLGWRAALLARIDDGQDLVRIVLRTKTLTLPAEASTAVHALFDTPQDAYSLPGLDRESSLVVSRRLLREGVVVPK